MAVERGRRIFEWRVKEGWGDMGRVEWEVKGGRGGYLGGRLFVWEEERVSLGGKGKDTQIHFFHSKLRHLSKI